MLCAALQGRGLQLSAATAQWRIFVPAAVVGLLLPDAAVHPHSADSGGECGVTVAARFSMPGSGFQANRQYNGSTEVDTSVGVSGSGSGNSGGSGSSRSIGSSSSGNTAASTAAAKPRPIPVPSQAPKTAASSAAVGGGAIAVAADAGNRKRRRPANPPFWYSFDYGAVHFVMVSSEHDLHKHSVQYKVRLLKPTDSAPAVCECTRWQAKSLTQAVLSLLWGRLSGTVALYLVSSGSVYC